ncbi:OsmC family peroxiredoxin [Haloplanus halophilus]|uniref:OsmC family peroxiredoxin n=1 Tax=Haloplanus halophilus TaxID=2949993 RepID=UPI00204141BA|nr:OsmC family peroxiredoxin [Haloplanus sp. GDY1]
MPTRTAEATWEGDLQTGGGTVALGSGAYEGPYSFGSRFEDAEGTNPEELIGAAEAGCFAMALANALAEDGFTPERIDAEASVHLDAGDLTIDEIELVAEGTVPDASEAEFREYAIDAKNNCPVSKALAGPNIELTADLR